MLNMQANKSGENCGLPSTGVSSQVASEDICSDLNYDCNQMHFAGNSCSNNMLPSQPQGVMGSTTQAVDAWNTIFLNGQSDTQGTGKPGCPETYENMNTRMAEIEKTLATIKETVTKTSVRCHLLNVDVVTMFNPETLDMLNKTMEQCDNCIKRMETIITADLSESRLCTKHDSD